MDREMELCSLLHGVQLVEDPWTRHLYDFVKRLVRRRLAQQEQDEVLDIRRVGTTNLIKSCGRMLSGMVCLTSERQNQFAKRDEVFGLRSFRQPSSCCPQGS